MFRHLRQNVEEQCGIENATKRARGLGFRARAGAQRLPKGPLACDLIMPDSSSIPFMIPPFCAVAVDGSHKESDETLLHKH